ncbi:MAG: ribosomal protein [Actinomycetota bacterium]|jgi:small subunit ribosomal protein S6
MRRYEMMLIVTDTVDEEAARAVVERAKEALAGQGGTLLDEAWWGRRRLAHEIAKRDHGFYAVLDFQATSEAVDELERQLGILDEVLRFKTVRPEPRIRSNA